MSGGYKKPLWLSTSASDEKLLAEIVVQERDDLDCGSSVSTSASNSDPSEEVQLEISLKRDGVEAPGMTYFAACERLRVRPIPQCAMLEPPHDNLPDQTLQLMIRSQG